MKKKIFSWGPLTPCVFVVCILVADFSGSLWFLHALLGDRQGDYTIGYYDSFLRSNSLAQSARDQHRDLLPSITDTYNRFVYRKNSEGEYIVGIPKINSQFSIVPELERQSWEVKRIGWIVIASHTDKPTPVQYSLVDAMSGFFRAILLQRLPIHPLLIAQGGSQEINAFSISVDKKRNGLHAVINTQSSFFSPSRSQRMGANAIPIDSMYVSLQREELLLMPQGFRSALESKVSELMKFTKTQPNILDSLSSLGSIVLAREGDSLAIGLMSSDKQPVSLLYSWIQREQGTRHPIKKAFSLPDKTLGYEYIPSASNAYFNLNKGNNNCLPTEGYDESLFLCSKDKVLVVSNEEHIGSNLVSSLQDETFFQRGIIQGRMVDMVGLADQFEKIEYAFRDDVVDVWADARSK